MRREGLSDGAIGALKIAQATALRLLETRVEGRPILSSWDALGDYLQAAMAHSPVEEVRVLFLNAKNMLLANEAMWRGSVDEASVHVREVISRAIALGATAIIIVHNHPSGDPSPSRQDIRLTSDLIEAGRHMRVTVHDHVIVGGGPLEHEVVGADLIKSRDVIKAIEAEGWRLIRTVGSHHHFRHPDRPGLVTVPHPSADLGLGTLKSIERQSGVKLRRS